MKVWEMKRNGRRCGICERLVLVKACRGYSCCGERMFLNIVSKKLVLCA